MKKELNILLVAIMFFTRIPVKIMGEYSSDMLNKASKYLPFIGYIVGAISALVFYISNIYFSDSIAIIFSMITAILTTGAFHEDGLADTFDAFGGGWTKEKKLEIMKDSRIGTYGSVALIIALLFKLVLISEFTSEKIVFVILVSHILSRLSPVVLIYFMNYVRIDSSSKSKPVGNGISFIELLVATAFAIIPLFYFDYHILYLIPVVILTQIFLALWFKKHLEGYTGDALGASQQLTELVILLTLVILWK